MNTAYFALAAFGGYCGTGWLQYYIWYLIHHGHTPPSPPDPWWRVIVMSVIGVLGGMCGAYLISLAFPSEVSLVTVSIGAFIGGRVVSNVYSLATMPSKAAKA